VPASPSHWRGAGRVEGEIAGKKPSARVVHELRPRHQALNCTIVFGITVGTLVFIAAGAVLNRDVADSALMLGVPARQAGRMSRFGERLTLSLVGNGETICPHTGDRYILCDGRLSLAGT
jgi:hypothetical protein